MTAYVQWLYAVTGLSKAELMFALVVLLMVLFWLQAELGKPPGKRVKKGSATCPKCGTVHNNIVTPENRLCSCGNTLYFS